MYSNQLSMRMVQVAYLLSYLFVSDWHSAVDKIVEAIYRDSSSWASNNSVLTSGHSQK